MIVLKNKSGKQEKIYIYNKIKITFMIDFFLLKYIINTKNRFLLNGL